MGGNQTLGNTEPVVCKLRMNCGCVCVGGGGQSRLICLFKLLVWSSYRTQVYKSKKSVSFIPVLFTAVDNELQFSNWKYVSNFKFISSASFPFVRQSLIGKLSVVGVLHFSRERNRNQSLFPPLFPSLSLSDCLWAPLKNVSL